MAPKTCPRCGADVWGLPQHQPHLCKDIKRRLARREKQRDTVEELLEAFLYSHDLGTHTWSVTPLAGQIVAALANMGVEED